MPGWSGLEWGRPGWRSIETFAEAQEDGASRGNSEPWSAGLVLFLVGER